MLPSFLIVGWGNSRKLLRAWLLVVGASVLSGCALAPGNYLGVVPNSISETDKDYVYDTSGTEDIAERADIFAITPTAVEKMLEERRMAELKASQQRAESASESSAEYKYLVGPQDVLRITVWNHPDLNNPAGTANQLAGRVVNDDGTFFFPYAGNVLAAGKTVQQIRDDLEKKLSKVLVEPQIDVSVLSYRHKRAFVLGQVERPGVVQLTDVPLTITDVIAQSGGLKPDADLKNATLTRNGKTRTIDLYALYYQGDITQNAQLSNGDVLTIPENRYNKVFVLGEVIKPQSLIMPRGRLTLAEALADVGGVNPLTANAGQLYVIRAGANNRPQIWYLNAASPDALVLADRFDLNPRDIVYVDPAGVARFGRVVRNIIPTASLLQRISNQ